MRSRRLAAALCSTALLVASCSSSDAELSTDGTVEPSVALARAAVAAEEAGSARIEMTFTMTGIPDLGDVTFGGTGEFDYADGELAMVLDMGALFEQAAGAAGGFGGIDLGDGEMEIRVVDGTGYLRFGLFSMMTGGASEWISFPADDMGGVGGFSPIPGGSNPADLFAVLGGGDNIETIGTEDVRGTPTTHYRGDFDPAAAAAQVPDEYTEELGDALDALEGTTFPIDVWIDADGLVRRMVMSMDGGMGGLLPAEAGDAAMRFEFELFDYGADIDVEAPEGAIDAEEAGLGGALGGFGG